MNVNHKSLWNKNFIFLLISNALLFLSLEMLTPTLPLLADNIGCTPSQIGLLVGIFTISAIAIRPFTSRLMRLMDKKYILLISILLCMMATGSYMFSTGLLVLLLFRLAHGFGFGVASVYYVTLASEELPIEHLGEGMGYFGVGESVCLSLGPLLGVAMLNVFDFSGLFTTGAIILLLAALMILGIKRYPIKENHCAEITGKKIAFKLVEKRVLPQAFLAMLIGIIFGGVLSFLSLFAKEQAISNVAWFFFISAITGVVIRVVSGRIFDRKGPIYVLIPAGISLIIAMLLIAYSQTALLLNTASAFYGIGIGLAFPALQAWSISLVDRESREDAMGSFLNFFDLGVGGGSFLLGFIVEATSYKTMYLLLIIIIIVYLALTVYVAKNKSIKHEKLAA